jgi:rhodanese-related sulfurtransferase
MRLRGHGLNARYMTGGIDAWQKAGRPLIAEPLSVI